MKFIASPLAVLGFNSNARAEISPIRVRVEQSAKAEVEKTTKKQTRSLKIFVSNASKDPADLVAKYYVFGREAKTNDIVKLDEGQKPVSVRALSTEMVESGVTTATFEEAHAASSGKGKPVEASGSKIVGFAVQVFQGEKMVAEAFDPPSMKEQIDKAPAAAKPAVKK